MCRCGPWTATRRPGGYRGEREKGLGHTPVVASTANAMAGDRDEALAAGMDGYLDKPVQLDELERLLTRWLPYVKGQSGIETSDGR